MSTPEHTPLRIAAIICAAGSSSRFGPGPGSKLDRDLHGKTVLARAVAAIARHPQVATTVVAGPADPAALSAFVQRHGEELAPLGASICPGGIAERFQTVKAGLEHLTASGIHFDALLVHDAARPCVPSALIRRVVEGLARHSAVVPAVPIADTLKRATTQTDGSSPVVETIDRSGLFACQTPQGFRADLIRRAYAQADLTSTDDAQLVERLGEPVMLVTGDPGNIKITHPPDLDLARAIWQAQAAQAHPAAKGEAAASQ